MLIGITEHRELERHQLPECLRKRGSIRSFTLMNSSRKRSSTLKQIPKGTVLLLIWIWYTDRVLELQDRSSAVTIVDSHLSHHIADIVIVLRTDPAVLKGRLEKRNYSEEKIKENLEAEALDIILAESVEWCDRVFEINTTDESAEKNLEEYHEDNQRDSVTVILRNLKKSSGQGLLTGVIISLIDLELVFQLIIST